MSVRKLIEKAEQSGIKVGRAESFTIGDSVEVHVKITEGEKERIQIFSGIVIAKKGATINASFTVRRLVGNEGVERVFPIHSPSVDKIDVKKSGKTRRAKLYYLRDRVGKATRLASKAENLVKPRASAAKPAAPKKEEAKK
ncbi:MAG: 50S ribosomal protein L19 [Planctomycetota bacterium]